MLIFGFANKSSVFAMKWSDLDFNMNMWGNMPLSDHAVVLLRDLPQNGKWVFPSRTRARHISDPRISWARLMDAAGTTGTSMDDVYKFMQKEFRRGAAREEMRNNMNNIVDKYILL